MKEMYRLAWVIVMLDAVEAGANRLALLAMAGRRAAGRGVRWLCRAPDEEMHSMICARIRRTTPPVAMRRAEGRLSNSAN